MPSDKDCSTLRSECRKELFGHLDTKLPSNAFIVIMSLLLTVVFGAYGYTFLVAEEGRKLELEQTRHEIKIQNVTSAIEELKVEQKQGFKEIIAEIKKGK